MTATEGAETLVREGASPGAVVRMQLALPVTLVTAGAVVGLASAQGGYFPTSWGLSATLLLWVTGLWIVISGRTDAGRIDALFLGLLTAFTCWVGLSISWSTVAAQSVLELERTLLVLAGVTAVIALARREHVPRLAGLILASITVVSTYALATRLFPDRLGSYDPVAGYRLSDPVGYWNTLGIFAAMGALLAVGVAVDAKTRWVRAGAAGSLVPLAATVYYTYSRGSWLALAFGLGVLVAFTPRRLRTVATTLVLAGPAALGVLLASRPYALTHDDASLAQSSTAGHRLAALLVVLIAAEVGLMLVLDLLQRRIAVPRAVRLACGTALVVVLLVVLAGVFMREGGPVSMTRHARNAFSASPHGTGSTSLNSRLFSFSGNGRAELWAAARDDYRAHRWTGAGAGTFERYWQSQKDASFKVRDAHSLYVETLAELGPFGLALLVCALLVPVGAGFLVRRQAMLPAALAAYAAFLVHAGVDWDWELSGVTLTALLIGSLVVVAARASSTRVVGKGFRVGATVAVVLASMAMIVAYLGNGALARAQTAVTDKSYVSAIDDANRARRLMPWSPWPLISRGDAQLAAGDSKDAAASYRHAISVDSGEWRAWLGLALATKDGTRAAAFAHARALYPRSAEIAEAAARLKDATKG